MDLFVQMHHAFCLLGDLVYMPRWFLSVCIVAVYGVCLHVFSPFSTIQYQINHHRHYCVAIVFDPGAEEECQFEIVFPLSSHCWRNGEYILHRLIQ